MSELYRGTALALLLSMLAATPAHAQETVSETADHAAHDDQDGHDDHDDHEDDEATLDRVIVTRPNGTG